MTERTDTITVATEEESILDAEDDLYTALGKLMEYRQTNDRETLLNAETAVKQSYFAIHDEIEDTAPEVNNG